MAFRFWRFTGGFIGGLVIGTAISIYYFDHEFGADSSVHRALAYRMEALATGHVEEICHSIVTGKQISGPDHLEAWSDGVDYLLVGWTTDQKKIPVIYWTGAGLPNDVLDCASITRK
jgi:hypothetical protein